MTFHNDGGRSGVQSHESLLTPGSVNSATFSKLLTLLVDGYAYPQPLYVSNYGMNDAKQHNVLFVTTEHDWVYAFDADGKNPAAGYLWKASLLGPGETWVNWPDVGAQDLSPDIGIVGTPVIDRAAGAIYVVAKSKTTSGPTIFYQRLHALNLASGLEKLNGPTVIQASLPGTGDAQSTVSFDPLRNNQRSALLLAPTPGGKSANAVFIAWASHGDKPPYHGWVISYDAADISKQTGVWVSTPNGAEGGIWMSANGLSTDGLGSIFGVASNGSFSANAGGSDYGQTLFRLTATPTGTGLQVADWFSPSDEALQSLNDQDFGTGGSPLVLQNPTGLFPHLILTTDKSGQIFVLNRDNLGHFGPAQNTDVQDFSDGGYRLHASLVFFNNAAYLALDVGPLEAWRLDPATSKFNTTPMSKSVHTFGCQGCYIGTNISISANGTSNGIVWAFDGSSRGFAPGVLYAFDAAHLANELYNSSEAAGHRDDAVLPVKFTSPVIANGKVYVAGREGVTVYGLFASLSPAPVPVITPATGIYATPQTVTIASATPGAKIYYTTTHGDTPSIHSTLYAGPFGASTSESVAAIAVADGYSASAVSSSYFGLRVLLPTFSLAPGAYPGSIHVGLFVATPGTKIYYTTDGTLPSAASALYTEPIWLPASGTIRAIGIKAGYEDSTVAQATYTLY